MLHPRRVRKTKKRPNHHTATPSPACDLLAGADVNARSQWWAGGFGRLYTADPELAAYAIERGAVVDVHAAARLGRLDRLRELIEGDPRRVHAWGGDGQTYVRILEAQLIAACWLQDSATVASLRSQHPDIAQHLSEADRNEIAQAARATMTCRQFS